MVYPLSAGPFLPELPRSGNTTEYHLGNDNLTEKATAG